MTPPATRRSTIWCSSTSTRCRGQYEVVENGRRRAAEPNLVVTAKDALAPFLDKWVPVPFLQVRPNNQFREGPADWARMRVVDLEARYGEGYPRRAGLAAIAPCSPSTPA